MKPYSDAGKIDPESTVIAMQTRLRLAITVPASLGRPGEDMPADFEPALRQAVADALLGLQSGWSVVQYVAVEQFADSEV